MTPSCRFRASAACRDQIPVAPIAAAVQLAIDEGWLRSYSDLARRLWGTRSDQARPDVSRVKRALGLAAHPASSRGGARRATVIRYSLAAQILAAAEIDPVMGGC